MSAAMSPAIRSRSSFEMPGSPASLVSISEREGVYRRREELRAEVADNGEVDPVLDLGEGVAPARSDDRARARESLVKFHHRLPRSCLMTSRGARSPVSAGGLLPFVDTAPT